MAGTTTVRWSIATPRSARGAIACISVSADDAAELDEFLSAWCGATCPPRTVRLAELLGVDRGVIARWSETHADLMPHAGPAVMRAVSGALTDALGPAHDDADYPEASSPIESRMLAALAWATSPRAIDLLLDQPRLWEHAGPDEGEADAPVLRRLLDPPLIVSVGAPNIGKSSLLNALAGRRVSLVADEPGTTRDHVGVLVELDGLVARYLDAPGTRRSGDAIEDEAHRLTAPLIERADLILSCVDATSEPVETPPGVPTMLVATRADAHPIADGLATSAATGRGLSELARAARSALVPDAALDDPRPWRFWEAPRPTA